MSSTPHIGGRRAAIPQRWEATIYKRTFYPTYHTSRSESEMRVATKPGDSGVPRWSMLCGGDTPNNKLIARPQRRRRVSSASPREKILRRSRLPHLVREVLSHTSNVAHSPTMNTKSDKTETSAKENRLRNLETSALIYECTREELCAKTAIRGGVPFHVEYLMCSSQPQ